MFSLHNARDIGPITQGCLQTLAAKPSGQSIDPAAWSDNFTSIEGSIVLPASGLTWLATFLSLRERSDDCAMAGRRLFGGRRGVPASIGAANL